LSPSQSSQLKQLGGCFDKAEFSPASLFSAIDSTSIQTDSIGHANADTTQELLAQGKGDNSQKFDEVDMDDLENVSPRTSPTLRSQELLLSDLKVLFEPDFLTISEPVHVGLAIDKMLGTCRMPNLKSFTLTE
jgi:hypothetical protein